MMRFIGLLFILCNIFGNATAQDKHILFFGDSITAGYGIAEQKAFPALIQQKVDSLGWAYSVRNGGLSGETSAGGLRRIDWMMQNPVDIFVLELGGNDALRGIDLSTTQQNLQQIITKVQQKYPDAAIVVTGMQVPPNLGAEYTKAFRRMYPALAESNDVQLIPFLMQGVGENPQRMQDDGIHPNEKGHRVMANTVWETLKPILRAQQ